MVPIDTMDYIEPSILEPLEKEYFRSNKDWPFMVWPFLEMLPIRFMLSLSSRDLSYFLVTKEWNPVEGFWFLPHNWWLSIFWNSAYLLAWLTEIFFNFSTSLFFIANLFVSSSNKAYISLFSFYFSFLSAAFSLILIWREFLIKLLLQLCSEAPGRPYWFVIFASDNSSL